MILHAQLHLKEDPSCEPQNFFLCIMNLVGLSQGLCEQKCNFIQTKIINAM